MAWLHHFLTREPPPPPPGPREEKMLTKPLVKKIGEIIFYFIFMQQIVFAAHFLLPAWAGQLAQ